MLPYFFAIPAIGSILLLRQSWKEGPFRGRWLLALGCGAAGLVQFQAATFSRSWLAALLAQVVLALSLAVRRSLPRKAVPGERRSA